MTSTRTTAYRVRDALEWALWEGTTLREALVERAREDLGVMGAIDVQLVADSFVCTPRRPENQRQRSSSTPAV